MKHYDCVEWIFYKEKALSEEKMMEMEEHLYTCNECLDTFLSLIDDKEVAEAEGSISSSFTSKVMSSIQNVEHVTKTNKSKTKHKEIFTYYVAVAAVTIVLTMGGFYNSLVDIVPHVAQSTDMRDNIKLPNIVADISGRIVNKTSDFINNFEVYNMEEDQK